MIYSLSNCKEYVSSVNPIVKSRIYGSNKVNNYSLEKDVTVKLSKGDVITIPKGFQWDLASVPKVFHWLLSPDNDAELAYLIHDYLYRFNYLSRRACDEEMYLWAKALNRTNNWYAAKNVDNFLRYTIVRMFGSGAYKKNSIKK